MSFALLCRSRSFVAFSLVSLGFLLVSPVRAAHWAVTYACNGTNTTAPSSPVNWSTTSNSNPVLESCGYGPYTSAISNGTDSVNGNPGGFTATLTWTKDGEPTLPPAPAQVYILQTLNCSATGSSTGSTVIDGWGDTFPGVGSTNCTGTFNHSLQIANPNSLTTLTLPVVTATAKAYNANGGGGNCHVSISLTTAVTTFALTINIPGTITVNNMQELITGQQAKASLAIVGSNATLSTYQWSVASADGGSPSNLVGGYSYSVNSGQTVAISPLSNGPVIFYDSMQDLVNVQATATVNVSGTPQTVVASTQVKFVKPTVTMPIPTQLEQDNFLEHPNDMNSTLGAYETWHNIKITMPTGFTNGTCCCAQIIKSTNRVDIKTTGLYTTYIEKVQNSNLNWVPIPTPSLDTNFPYFSGISPEYWSVAAAGGAEDYPYFSVAPQLVPSDTGTWGKEASGQDKFTTWIMYNPNPTDGVSIWVPLESFDWNWYETAALNTTTQAWQAASANLLPPSDPGSDYAPTNTWPTWTAVGLIGNTAMRP